MKSTANSIQLTPDEIRRSLLMAAIGGTTILASFIYAPWSHTGPVMCPFRLATGLPCPGCGLTRSFCCLARGDLHGAFSNHLLGPVLAAGLVIGIPLLIGEVITKRRNLFLRRILYSKRVGYVAAITLMMYHFGRLIEMGYTGALWAGMHHSVVAHILHYV